MPYLNGFQLLRAIKYIKPDLPVIFISGFAHLRRFATTKIFFPRSTQHGVTGEISVASVFVGYEMVKVSELETVHVHESQLIFALDRVHLGDCRELLKHILDNT